MLHFAEIRDDEPGLRIMDVSFEDILMLDDFDLYTEAGGINIALIRTFTNVLVQDGQLNMLFAKSTEDVERRASIAAIEIGTAGSLVPVNQPPTAVVVATPDSGQAPLVVQFTGSNSFDSDGTITSFNWYFGDGMTSAQAKYTAHL